MNPTDRRGVFSAGVRHFLPTDAARRNATAWRDALPPTPALHTLNGVVLDAPGEPAPPALKPERAWLS